MKKYKIEIDIFLVLYSKYQLIAYNIHRRFKKYSDIFTFAFLNQFSENTIAYSDENVVFNYALLN